ncbi:MAG TPA: carboxypeptidase-like regulatory domain-containing protein [Vicinamibacterales bacterium]|nr:carboxypeptidase-like regulatory domain-containing protein [Vicinamibacterales bacterium]
MTRWLSAGSVLLWIASLALVPQASADLAAQGGGQAPAGGGGQQGRGAQLPPRAGRLAEPVDAPKGTAALRGQVVAIDTGTPIRRAQVRVSAQNARQSRLAITDTEGRFEIRDLAAARYTLTASKGGFVTLQYGQRRPGESGTPLEVADGQTLDKLVIGLPRGSVIGGRVTDEYGEPVANALVMALRYAYAGGARRLMPAGARDTTDDQGSYRLFGLPPGEYLVSAVLRTGNVTDPGDDLSGYAPTYFPGTPSPTEAQRVRLDLAQENTAVSFGLVATRLVQLSGQVISSTTGTPPSGGIVVVGGAGGARDVTSLLPGGGGRIDGTGAFRVSNVPPGRYQLQARTGGPRGEGEFARMEISVGADDVEGLTLVTAPAGRLTGTVVTDTGDPLPTSPPPVQVVARPAAPDAPSFGGGGGQAQGRVSNSGAFELGNMIDPRLIRVTAPQGWTLKSVLLNGQDVTDTPVDVPPGQRVTGVQVIITRKVSGVMGTVLDDRRLPVLDATVVMFPADENLRTFQSRFIKAARPDQEGKFRIADLPPGDYLAVAVQGLEDGRAGDPEFMTSVEEQATAVTIEEGETRTVNLELGRR